MYKLYLLHLPQMLERFAFLGQCPMNFFWVKVPVQVRTNGIAGLLIQEALDEFIGDIFGHGVGKLPARSEPFQKFVDRGLSGPSSLSNVPAA